MRLCELQETHSTLSLLQKLSSQPNQTRPLNEILRVRAASVCQESLEGRVEERKGRSCLERLCLEGECGEGEREGGGVRGGGMRGIRQGSIRWVERGEGVKEG